MKTKHFSKALCLILTLAMILSVTAMPMMANAATQILDEDFDGEAITFVASTEATEGTWSSVQAATGTNVLDTTISVEKVDGSNVLQYVKTGKSSSQDNQAKYTFKEPFSGGIISAKFRVKRTGLKRILFAFGGYNSSTKKDNGRLELGFFSSGQLYFGKSGSGAINTGLTFAENTWYEFEMLYDFSTGKSAVYDWKGNCLLTFTDEKTAGDTNVTLNDNVKFFEVKTSSSEATGTFWVDDVEIYGMSTAEFDLGKISVPALYEGTNLTLPTTGDAGSTITWTSSHPEIISTTGVVTPDTATKTVTLTAAIGEATKTFTVEVPGEESAAQKDIAAISLPSLYEGTNLTLPTVGENGSTIAWSSNSTVISNSGAVTPAAATTVVTLTATATDSAGKTASRNFTVKVLGKNMVIDEDFEVPVVADGTILAEATIPTADAIIGYNGWRVTKANNNNVENTTATITTFENSKMLLISRTAPPEGQASSSIKEYKYIKTFEDVFGGKLRITFKEQSSQTERFYVEIAGSTFDFNMRSSSYFKVDGVEYTIKSNVEGWNEFDITLDLDTNKASILINGKAATQNGTVAEIPLPKCGGIVNTFTFIPNTSVNQDVLSIYLDDIKAEHLPSDMPLTVAGIEFADADGNVAAGKVAGGTVKTVSVAAKEETLPASTAVIVGVYDGDGKLYSAGKGIAGKALEKNVAVEIEVNAKLPSTGIENTKIRVFALNSMNNLVPISNPFDYTPGEKTTLFMLGDSMTCNYAENRWPLVGVGMVIGDYFDENYVQVTNLGRSGASTKSFYNLGVLQENLANIKHGDYVFIMFGHNDQQNVGSEHYATKATDPHTTYQDYLTNFIVMARSRGAIPVLMTPITRQQYASGEADCMGEYPAAMIQLGQKLNVPVIDNTTYSQTYLDGLGDDAYEEAKWNFYAWAEAGDVTVFDTAEKQKSESFANGISDETHMSVNGANYMAEYIAQQVEALGLPLGVYKK